MWPATIRLWGLTAFDAYLAYNDSAMLDLAVQMWDQTIAYQLTDRDVEEGFSKIQNASVPARCNGCERIQYSHQPSVLL